jgi:hypothetical protein
MESESSFQPGDLKGDGDFIWTWAYLAEIPHGGASSLPKFWVLGQRTAQERGWRMIFIGYGFRDDWNSLARM